jgi:hypothetical protein
MAREHKEVFATRHFLDTHRSKWDRTCLEGRRKAISNVKGLFLTFEMILVTVIIFKDEPS